MPRVIPKSYAAHLDERERIRSAAADFHRDKEQALEAAQRRHGLPVTTVRDRGDGDYTPDGEHSWFRDKLVEADYRALVQAGADRGDPRIPADGPGLPHPVHGDVAAARKRLATVQTELRDVTSADPGAAGFIPTGPPAYIANLFADATRTRGVLASALRREPLPAKGLVVKTPLLETGASVAVHDESSAVSETDVDSTIASTPVAMISGQVDVSRAALERAAPGFDQVLATELASALASSVDSLLLTGSGSAPNPLGLLSVSGITTVSYTDTTATQAEAWPKLVDLYQQTANALGIPPDLMLIHPRRMAWFQNWKDTSTGIVGSLPWPCEVLLVPSIPVTLGASTNEDRIIFIRRDELPILIGPVEIDLFPETGSGNLRVRVQGRVYMATLFSRRPKAIGLLTSTGLSSPVYT